MRVSFFLFFISMLFSTLASSQEWKQFADSAKIFRDLGENEEAIKYYGKAREMLKKDSMFSASYAQVCSLLGGVYFQTRQYPEALEVWTETMEIRQKVLGKENKDYAQSCHNLGNVYLSIQEYEKAEPFYLEGKKIREKVTGKISNEYAASISNLALLYRYTKRFSEAEPLAKEVKSIHQQLGIESTGYANAVNNLALLYTDMGLPDKVVEEYSGLMSVREKIGGKTDGYYMASLEGLAGFYYTAEEFEKAITLYHDLVSLREQTTGKNESGYATALNDLGLVYQAKGAYEKAEALFLESVQIRELVAGKEDEDYLLAAQNLASLYLQIGQYKKAEPLYFEIMSIREKVYGKNNHLYAAACTNLASLYMYIAQYDKAETYYIQAVDNFQKLGQHYEYSQCCSNLGALYASKGNNEKALEFFQKAMEIQEKMVGKNSKVYANSLEGVANIYDNLKEFKKAEELYLETKKIRSQLLGKHHPDYGYSCINMANHYWIRDSSILADKEFSELFSVHQHNLKEVFQFTNEEEKTNFVQSVSGEVHKAYSFYVDADIESNQPYNISLFWRNLVLASGQDLVKVLNSSSDTALQRKFAHWSDLKKKLAELYSLPLNERGQGITAIETQAGSLEKELTRLSKIMKMNSASQETNAGIIRERLGEDEAAIEFVEFPYYHKSRPTDKIYYAAIILRKNSRATKMVYLFEKKSLDSVLKSKKAGVANQVNYVYKYDIRSSLYDLIWEPVEQYLDGVKRVFIAPSGLFHKISFAALPLSESSVLSDKYELVVLNSTNGVIASTSSGISQKDNIQLFGAVIYDADSISMSKSLRYKYEGTIVSRSQSEMFAGHDFRAFDYLGGSEQEVKQIAELARQYKYSAFVTDSLEANEEAVKNLYGSNSPAILHIATHGFFFPDNQTQTTGAGANAFRVSSNPLIRSGLVMAGGNNAWKGKPVKGIEDGILTAYEVSNLYLPNTKLAVLSACETGLGDIQGSEGVYGLQRAFKIAGVENLIMSLWKVPDLETAEFMQAFYKNIFSGQIIPDAFYSAQQQLKNKYRNQPYKWAAWILVR